MLPKEIIANLDPGVKKLVVWLNKQGWNTVDSGDGYSKPKEGRVLDFPHIFILLQPQVDLEQYAKRLWQDIRWGLNVEEEFKVELTYEPYGEAILAVYNLTDEKAGLTK